MKVEEQFLEFENLYKELALPDCDRRFIKDGVIEPSLFNKQTKRLLFIAKEHNYASENFDPTYAADYRVWCQQHVHLQFAHRVSEWAYGILNEFIGDFDEITYDQKHQALKSIAFINVKKSSGRANANSEVITAYIEHSRNLLLKQIADISPSMIVCCFRYDNYPQQLFGIKMERPASNLYSYGTWSGVKIINFYHPSSRKNKRSLYQSLAQAVMSTN